MAHNQRHVSLRQCLFCVICCIETQTWWSQTQCKWSQTLKVTEGMSLRIIWQWWETTPRKHEVQVQCPAVGFIKLCFLLYSFAPFHVEPFVLGCECRLISNDSLTHTQSCMCVYVLKYFNTLFFCVGSADQFEEILSQYEELKVTQWVHI